MSRAHQVPLRICQHCGGGGMDTPQRQVCNTCLGVGVTAEIGLTVREVIMQLQMRLRDIRTALTPYCPDDDMIADMAKPQTYRRFYSICSECRGHGYVGNPRHSLPCSQCVVTGVMMGDQPADPVDVTVPMRQYLAKLNQVLKTCRQRDVFPGMNQANSRGAHEHNARTHQ